MNHEDTLSQINLWHQRARPRPTDANLAVQFGRHIDEFLEMFESISVTVPDNHAVAQLHARIIFRSLATALRMGKIQLKIDNREELLNGLAGQIVTAVGIGHYANMDVPEACSRVNDSNWSKFTPDGYPVYKRGSKIDKGPNYTEPKLDGLY